MQVFLDQARRGRPTHVLCSAALSPPLTAHMYTENQAGDGMLDHERTAQSKVTFLNSTSCAVLIACNQARCRLIEQYTCSYEFHFCFNCLDQGSAFSSW